MVNSKNIDLEKIHLSLPEKMDTYVSKATYSGSQFLVQFDNVEVNVENEEIVYDIDTQKIVDHCQEMVFQNSADWFKGKSFSHEYIQKAFRVEIFKEGAKYFDNRKNRLYLSELQDTTFCKASIVAEFTGLQFSGKTIVSQFKVKQVKFDFEFIFTDECLIEEEPKIEEPVEISIADPEIVIQEEEITFEELLN